MRLVFAGTPSFAERALAALCAAGHDPALVLTQPDRPVGRGLRLTPSPVKRFAAEMKLPVFQPASLKPPEAIERIQSAGAEIMIVAAYGLLLPPAALEATPRGAINIHASLLPRWRGAAPIQRAILAGDRETGISIMQMDAGLDTGAVLSRRALPIAAEDDAGTLHDKLADLGAALVLETLAALVSGRAHAEPQPAEGVTYAAKIEKGETRLDWSRPAAELARAVRAYRPAPGAIARLGEDNLKIWRAREVEGRGASGEILDAGPAGLRVACGTGALEILELQREGGRRLAATEFLRGRVLRRGERFE